MTDKESDIDWSVTTFEGARREQLRRWSKLPLERILAAIEEMEDLSRQLAAAGKKQTREILSVKEREEEYPKGNDKNSG